MKKKIKNSGKGLHCKICSFTLTAGEAKVGDICPWCNKGYLELPVIK